MSINTISKLATGTMTAGPKDELATADIYKLASSAKSTINSIQDSVGKLETSIFGNIGSDIGDLLSNVGGELNFDASALTDRIAATSDSLKRGFRELSDSVKNNSLVATYKDKAKELACMVDDYKSVAKTVNSRDIASLGRFVNEYTGTKIFSGNDKGALAGVLGSVVNKASELGVTGVFTKLTSTLTDNGLVAKVVKAALPVAMKNGDFKLLRELSSSPAGKLINVFSPGFTNTITRTFSSTNYAGRSSFNSYEDILTSLSNVDSQWDMLARNGGDTALNLVAILGGSKDFQKLILGGISYFASQNNQRDKKEYALASLYKQTTVYDSIRRDFPRIVMMDLERPRYSSPKQEVSSLSVIEKSLRGFFS